jgi:hypothetical protein
MKHYAILHTTEVLKYAVLSPLKRFKKHHKHEKHVPIIYLNKIVHKKLLDSVIQLNR